MSQSTVIFSLTILFKYARLDQLLLLSPLMQTHNDTDTMELLRLRQELAQAESDLAPYRDSNRTIAEAIETARAQEEFERMNHYWVSRKITVDRRN